MKVCLYRKVLDLPKRGLHRFFVDFENAFKNLPGVSVATDPTQADVFYDPSGLVEPSELVNLPAHVVTVVALHDATPWVMSKRNWMRNVNWETRANELARRVSAIVTPSESARLQLVDAGLPEDKIVVIYP